MVGFFQTMKPNLNYIHPTKWAGHSYKHKTTGKTCTVVEVNTVYRTYIVKMNIDGVLTKTTSTAFRNSWV